MENTTITIKTITIIGNKPKMISCKSIPPKNPSHGHTHLTCQGCSKPLGSCDCIRNSPMY